MSIDESSKNLLRTIEEGLQNGEFKMYLQFIVDNKTNSLVSAEALSRWETAEGVVSPGKYIRAMEDSGLITVLDYQMFENACRKLSEWVGTECDAVSISCNFTRITISDADFADKITGMLLDECGIASDFDGELPFGVTAHSRTDEESVYVFLQNYTIF